MNGGVVPFSLFTEYDIHLFRNGLHYKLYNLLGSHLVVVNGVKGVYFAVWAPSASNVTVMGDFNYWRTSQYRLNPRWDNSGIWEGFVPGVKQGAIYKYNITGPDGKVYEKGDPYAFRWEVPPGTGSIVWDIKDYSWRDKSWLEGRKKFNKLQSPISAYEVHLGSWKKPERKETSFLTYKQLKDELVPYVKEMGFTHVELMPVMEHPYYPSWGYQIIGYYATTSRFGSPQEFMELVDAFHQEGIGVILDWVPSHFPSDGHSLSYFDGTHLYEHGNPQLGYHPDWKSLIFDYGKKEVKSFLISNAVFWCEMYHADGLRVDAVASMIHLDYSRKDGEWTPNKHGGRENLEAIDFIKEMNQAVHAYHPDVITIAEESTSFPFVTAPVNDGGLGFDEKWMMGWMHDTLKYFALDPIHRQFHHDQITFSMVYAYSEKFVLPFSHDEVVHGKGSLLTRMPGDEWQKFANLRAMLGYMFTHPGAKLLFMGGEFGQSWEWSHINGLEWHLLRFAYHSGIQGFVKELNRLYTTYNALYYHNFHPAGFEWLSVNDRENSVLIFLRKGKTEVDKLIIVLNLTPVIREHYRFGVPDKGSWRELLNSDDKKWGGSGVHNKSAIRATKKTEHNRDYSISITCPPLSIVVFEPVRVVRKTVKKRETVTQLEQDSNKKYICIHGHFYQPPRENAWLEEIQSQPSASPFSNWNERIAYECYSPNRAARILDDEGNILYIVNNYEKISFNFGPTLLSWLEEHDADTYLEIIEADRKSVKENNGHGNAIAQIYNHVIMPLASEAEKELQVFWGVRDFVFRYGRNPEGMWLSETAVDTATLIALRRNGILFTILAPRQADAVKEKNGEWILCSEKAVDTGKPYKVILPDGDSIAVFFYDGSISQKVAFEGLLNDGVAFASMLMQAADQKDYDALISIATDGESYGHHHRYGEMALSSCIYHIGQHPDYILTNYAAYLAMFPPVDEVRIKENTSWSCYHGVERWRADCGCNTGSHPRWNQKYRQPLRDSLNWLSNQLSRLFNDKNKLFYNAHDALLNYIDVVLDRSEVSTEYFLRKYVIRPDSESNGVDALKLLEMMRHANLMFTSCGWFFDEISGLETTQILQYARRAITHAEYFGLFLEDGFRQRLELCPTNLPEYSSGKDVYETVVRPSEIRLLQVAMHMSVLSVFEEVPSEMTLYKFFANHETFVREEKGDQKLVIGHAVMKSVLTRAELEYNFSVLVYKGIDLIGYVKQGAPDEGFNYFIRTAKELFQQDELDKLSGYFRDYFKTGSFDFSNLFKDEKINLLNIISKRNIKNAVARFRNIFNVNYPLLYEMEKVGFPISKGFLEIVAFVFNADIIDELSVSGDVDIAKLRQLTADLKKWKVPIEDPERIAFLAERQIFAQIRRLNENIKNPIPHELIDFLLDWVYGLNLPINLWQSQNEFYEINKQISIHPDTRLEQIAKKLKFA